MKFHTIYYFLFILIASSFIACSSDDEVIEAEPLTLQEYVDVSTHQSISRELYACAAGNSTEFLNDMDFPISVFFYPFAGATDYQYFESSDNTIDTTNFSSYVQQNLEGKSVFNGALHRFLNPGFDNERFGIITYRVNDVLHISEAIRLQPNTAPTLNVFNEINIQSDNTTPYFEWTDGTVTSNDIYFSVVTDVSNNMITGLYTYDQFWQFYDLSNVVLNVTDDSTTPQLSPNTEYKYVLMGVDNENWVHTFAEKPFQTGE